MFLNLVDEEEARMNQIFYVGNEINPNLKKFLDTNLTWKEFFNKNKILQFQK